jgi:hypothetical protein
VLATIKEKLRPVLMRKWRTSQEDLLQAALEAGVSEEDLPLFMAGVRHGYWRGAGDITEIKASDLRSRQKPAAQESDRGKKFH